MPGWQVEAGDRVGDLAGQCLGRQSGVARTNHNRGVLIAAI